jgi:hypothetical protein
MSELYESPDSQAETAGRVPELAGFTMMHQSRRMMQRPGSLQGVELADGNRFFVNLGAQAETCARPIMFSNGTFQKPVFNTSPTNEVQEMTAAANTTPFAWDFRANAVDALSSMERNFDWPALDEAEYRRPEIPQPSRVWSKTPSLSRIPALNTKPKKAAADADALRSLLQEAMDREAQRITVTTRAYKVDETDEQAEKKGPIESARMLFSKIKNQFSQLGKALARA